MWQRGAVTSAARPPRPRRDATPRTPAGEILSYGTSLPLWQYIGIEPGLFSSVFLQVFFSSTKVSRPRNHGVKFLNPSARYSKRFALQTRFLYPPLTSEILSHFSRVSGKDTTPVYAGYTSRGNLIHCTVFLSSTENISRRKTTKVGLEVWKHGYRNARQGQGRPRKARGEGPSCPTVLFGWPTRRTEGVEDQGRAS